MEESREEVKKTQRGGETRKLRPTAFQVFFNIFVAVFSVLVFRWLVFEMFLIPSGSMYPHLFERDYIVATKYDFGLRLPFSQTWAIGPFKPKRGEVVIFKSMDDSKFFIKRLIGLPGDKIKLEGDLIVSINGEAVTNVPLSSDEHEQLSKYTKIDSKSFSSFKETIPGVGSAITVLSTQALKTGVSEFEVPLGNLLVMGDNRHRSYDGRFFGYLPMTNLVGKARRVVFSCEKYNPGTTSCDMKSIRFDRLGKKIGH